MHKKQKPLSSRADILPHSVIQQTHKQFSAVSLCRLVLEAGQSGEDARFCQALILRRAEHSGKAVWHQERGVRLSVYGRRLIAVLLGRPGFFLSDRGSVSAVFCFGHNKGDFAAFIFCPGSLCALCAIHGGRRAVFLPSRSGRILGGGTRVLRLVFDKNKLFLGLTPFFFELFSH